MTIRALKVAQAAMAAATVLTSAASAADLGTPYARRGPPPEPYYGAPMQIERWTGFYFGGTLGYASGTTGVDGASGNFNFDTDGGMGTLFAGYNWQTGGTVLGLEGDIGTGNLSGSGRALATALGSDVNVFGSLRGRFGVLLSPALLAYATAGVAWADMDLTMSGIGTSSETFWGYQLGGGAEYMMASNWSLRLEYVYTDLDAERVSHAGIPNTFDPDFHTVRAGIAFKF